MRTVTSSLPPERFGVTGGSQTKKWAKLSPSDRRRWIERDVLLMKYAGVRWVRVDLPVSGPLPSGYSDYLGLLRDNGIQVLAYLPIYSLPPDIKAFQQDVARRMRSNPEIRVWEAGNEPNLSRYWSDSLDNYVVALQAVYEAVKGTDSGCQVACGGVSDWKPEALLDTMVRRDAHRWMDIFAFHPYAANPNQVMERLFGARAQFAGSPLHDKPVWITEIGFHSQANWKNNAGHVADENVKADYLDQTFAMLGRFTQGPIFWYTFQEDGTGSYLGYGLLNQVIDSGQNRQSIASHVIFSAAFERYRALSGASANNSLDFERILRMS